MLNNCTSRVQVSLPPSAPLPVSPALKPLCPKGATFQPDQASFSQPKAAGPIVVKAATPEPEVSWFDRLAKYTVFNPLAHAGLHFWGKVVPVVVDDVKALWGALTGQPKAAPAPVPAPVAPAPVAAEPVGCPRPDPKAQIAQAFKCVFGYEMPPTAEGWYLAMHRGGKSVEEIEAWMVDYNAHIQKVTGGK